MKKVTVILLAIFLSLSFIGCGNTQNTSSQDTYPQKLETLKQWLVSYTQDVKSILEKGTDVNIITDSNSLNSYIDMIYNPDPQLIMFVSSQTSATATFNMGKVLEDMKNILTQFYPYDGKTPISQLLKYNIATNGSITIVSFAVPIGKEDTSFAQSHKKSYNGQIIENENTLFIITTLKIDKNNPQHIEGPITAISDKWPIPSDI